LLRDRKRVINFDAEVTNRALRLSGAKRQSRAGEDACENGLNASEMLHLAVPARKVVTR